MLQEQKIQISSNNLNIATLRHAFYQNPSYEKAILLAQTYLDMKDYNKSIFWSLKANDINKISNTSWKLFAKAKQAQGFEEDAKKVLELYAKHYEVELLQ
ncbi:hypothetical protein CGP82_01270 [Campylobacter sp. LR185c]|nr:hypothetical protein CGP82_01270 [Campylobacter sp. LR185c]